MRARAIELALWACAVGGAAAAGIGWREATRQASGEPARAEAPVPALARPEVDTLYAAVDEATAGNLFRPDRAPADTVPAAPAPSAPPGPPTPPAPPKPALLLRGVLGGPPWDALVEGFPGKRGSVVVRAGDVIAGLTVRAVRKDTVIVQGADTTWTLTMRRP